MPDSPRIGTLRVQPECDKDEDHNKRQDEDKVVEDEIGQPFGKRVVRAHESEDRKIDPPSTRQFEKPDKDPKYERSGKCGTP